MSKIVLVKNGFEFTENVNDNINLKMVKEVANAALERINKELTEESCDNSQLQKDKERIEYFVNMEDKESLEYVLFVSSRYVNKEDLVLKKLEDLHEGKCTVVYESTGTIKKTEGSYNKKFNLVFMCVPSESKILGYLQ